MGVLVPEEKADLAGALEHQDASRREAQCILPSVATLRTRPGGVFEEEDKETDVTSDLTASPGREHTENTSWSLNRGEERRAGTGVACEIMAVILTDGNTNLDKVHIHSV